MRRLLLLLLVTILLLLAVGPVQAQAGIEVTDVRVDYAFGTQITFTAHIQSASPVREVSLLFRGVYETTTRIYPAQFSPDGQASYRFDASQNTLQPFAPILFWFQVALQDGQTFSSSRYQFVYADNRFDWQTLTEGGLHLHWYNGDAAFGQIALDTSSAGLQRIGELIPLQLDQPIEVYLYASADELQQALVLGGQSWTAGHASPALGVVLAAVTPGAQQQNQMEQLIPHELMHVLLYRQLGPAYANLPAWLREGLATISELYPNPDYAHALNLAAENDQLIPFNELCQAFPSDPSGAFLAYAESASFTRYLRNNYGNSGLENLIRTYADGLNCEQGALRALGLPLNQLEARWRESALGENATGMAARNLIPYLILLLLVLAVPTWSVVRVLRQRKEKSA